MFDVLFDHAKLLNLVLYLSTTAVVLAIIDSVRNVFFHRLSTFPGPRLAAASSWWSAWQQAILGKSMHHICERLHERYGGSSLHLS